MIGAALATLAHAGITQTFVDEEPFDRTPWEDTVGDAFTEETFDDATLVAGLSVSSLTLTSGRFAAAAAADDAGPVPRCGPRPVPPPPHGRQQDRV